MDPRSAMQPKGKDQDRPIVEQLHRTVPAAPRQQLLLVGESHRLSHANDKRMSVGAAIFES
jgi:hypothetical protein